MRTGAPHAPRPPHVYLVCLAVLAGSQWTLRRTTERAIGRRGRLACEPAAWRKPASCPTCRSISIGHSINIASQMGQHARGCRDERAAEGLERAPSFAAGRRTVLLRVRGRHHPVEGGQLVTPTGSLHCAEPSCPNREFGNSPFTRGEGNARKHVQAHAKSAVQSSSHADSSTVTTTTLTQMLFRKPGSSAAAPAGACVRMSPCENIRMRASVPIFPLCGLYAGYLPCTKLWVGSFADLAS